MPTFDELLERKDEDSTFSVSRGVITHGNFSFDLNEAEGKHVELTLDMIRSGHTCNTIKCPFALMINNAFPIDDFFTFRVYDMHVSLCNIEPGYFSQQLPVLVLHPRLNTWLRDFDSRSVNSGIPRSGKTPAMSMNDDEIRKLPIKSGIYHIIKYKADTETQVKICGGPRSFGFINAVKAVKESVGAQSEFYLLDYLKPREDVINEQVLGTD